MKGKNKYFRRSHISEAKFRAIIRYFVHDLPASKIADLSDISRPTINKILLKLRIRMAQVCEDSSPLSGEIEVDESYFGARRVRGKRGRGASGKTIVFGLLERQGKVYTEIVPDASKKQLQAAIRGKASLDSIIHSDGWRGYNGLVDVGYEKHLRVHHGKNEFARGNCHINGIESFWSYAKRRLAKFNGVPKETFYFHLKECEFRFNHREENLYDRILTLLRENQL
ncbi:IS1595 family transposase [Candidatus Thiosymbion oneisti]|uniref:IS1595 family transposase n=1 Tax=Candidatus Thiosymbion oneisti TaxID=589554 RepID=UPI000A5E7169|nr:IS1595 family transposase [Candidatus Thiosymbion oneisti]